MDTSWSQRIIELESIGWSLKAIAEHIDLSPQAVSDIKRGSSKAPTGMAAVRLYELHREKLGSSGGAAHSPTAANDDATPAAAQVAG